MTIPYKIVDAAGKTVATLNALPSEKVGVWQYSAAKPNGVFMTSFVAPAVAPPPTVTNNRVTNS